jgi:two-component system, response regulator
MTAFEQVEILLVEDNPTYAELAIRALRKKNLANNLVWVKDGVEALDFIFCKGQYENRANLIPKLILLDLKLPKIDGIEVLRTIKSDPKTRTIPVVMLTSSHEERDIVEKLPARGEQLYRQAGRFRQVPGDGFPGRAVLVAGEQVAAGRLNGMTNQIRDSA